VRATLQEALALFGAHLHLLTLLSLTVWLPVHVLVNYLEFFGDSAPEPGRSFALGLLAQAALDPIAAGAILTVLARSKLGQPADYGSALLDGARAWSRLLPVRLVLMAVLVLPAVAARDLHPASAGAGAGLLLIALTVIAVVFLLVFALAESVVVLEGRGVLSCWRRAAALSAGRRRLIFGTSVVVFGLLSSVAILASLTLRADPALNHFVVRTLFDCALSVSQTLFTIALFVVYWRAAQPVVCAR
jgi:hypothetical protein